MTEQSRCGCNALSPLVSGLSVDLAPPPAQSSVCQKVFVAAQTSVYQVDGNSNLFKCAKGFTGAHGIAADANANLWVTDESTSKLYFIPRGCGTPKVVMSSASASWFVSPRDVAIDASGRVVVSMMNADPQWATRGVMYAYRRVYALTFDANQILTGSSMVANTVADGLSFINNLGFDSSTGLWGARQQAFLSRWNASAAVGWKDWTSAGASRAADIIDLDPAWTRCGSLFFAASANNVIYRCSQLNNPASCQPLCNKRTDSSGCEGFRAPWGVVADAACNAWGSSQCNCQLTSYSQSTNYTKATLQTSLPHGDTPYSLTQAVLC